MGRAQMPAHLSGNSGELNHAVNQQHSKVTGHDPLGSGTQVRRKGDTYVGVFRRVKKGAKKHLPLIPGPRQK